ncbi:MAG: transposase [Candidatus Kapabacteria bacterium]|nr:transposase [Candidatus Kapabacteria bacterium]
MRMKEDHMRNGQLKAGYNVQIGTNNQYITSFGIYQTPGDSTTLPNVVETHKRLYGQHPETVVADAGYGSEENYLYLNSVDCTGYVKYNHFDMELSGSLKKKKPYYSTNLEYVPEGDYCVCPNGKKMHKIYTGKSKSLTGFKQDLSYYQVEEDCVDCPFKEACTPQKDRRTIQINHRLRIEKKSV